MKATLKRLGFRHAPTRGFPGSFAATKRLPSNIEIEIPFDIGSYSHTWGAGFGMNGPGWRAFVHLPVTHWGENSLWYPIVNAEVWQMLLENAAVTIGYLENHFAPEIEAIYGPAPAWFQYDG